MTWKERLAELVAEGMGAKRVTKALAAEGYKGDRGTHPGLSTVKREVARVKADRALCCCESHAEHRIRQIDALRTASRKVQILYAIDHGQTVNGGPVKITDVQKFIVETLRRPIKMVNVYRTTWTMTGLFNDCGKLDGVRALTLTDEGRKVLQEALS